MTDRKTWLGVIAGALIASIACVVTVMLTEPPTPACKPCPLTVIEKKKALS